MLPRVIFQREQAHYHSLEIDVLGHGQAQGLQEQEGDGRDEHKIRGGQEHQAEHRGQEEPAAQQGSIVFAQQAQGEGEPVFRGMAFGEEEQDPEGGQRRAGQNHRTPAITIAQGPHHQAGGEIAQEIEAQGHLDHFFRGLKEAPQLGEGRRIEIHLDPAEDQQDQQGNKY